MKNVVFVAYNNVPYWLALEELCSVSVADVGSRSIELCKVSNLVASSVGLISSSGSVGPLLLPVGVGYLRDTSESFLSGVIMLAAVAGVTSILRLLMRETRRARSI